jgi:hypothetical protein
MRLFEFADNDPLRVKLMGVSNQLDNLVKDTDSRMSTDEFLQLLRQNGVVLGKSDLFDLVKKEPLVNFIANVNGDQVVFKSQQPDEVDQGADENAKIRQQMASKQVK